LLALFIALG